MTKEPSPYTIEDVRGRLRIGEMVPERYVALNAHKWMMAGPLAYSYADSEVEAHVRRVEELMRDHDNIDALRMEWLSPDEYERIRAEIAQMAEPDYDL